MNTYFSFKKFTIHQDKCAMKVCTDACLFGAFVANKLEKNTLKEMLDIGTGTGLLSLMLTQKTIASIDTVEIDINAFEQAKSNIKNSIYANRINIFLDDILNYNPPKKYDCIVSNPPFFENQLKSPDELRNTAMHATTLSFDSLIEKIKHLLSENGKAYLLLPFYAIADFEALLLKQQLFINEQVNVSHNPTKPYFRVFVEIGFIKAEKIEISISINNVHGTYSDEFQFLLKDYYLKL